jgi:hypothetical protein
MRKNEMKLVIGLMSAVFAVTAVAAEPAKKEAAKPVEKDGMLLPAKKEDKAPAKKEEKKEAKKEEKKAEAPKADAKK